MISKKLLKALEKKFSIESDGNSITVNTRTDYGEEFYEELKGSTDEEILESAEDAYRNFDIDEHFNIWWGANKGEPQTASELLKACENYKSYLEDLYNTIEKVVNPLPAKKNAKKKKNYFADLFDKIADDEDPDYDQDDEDPDYDQFEKVISVDDDFLHTPEELKDYMINILTSNMQYDFGIDYGEKDVKKFAEALLGK